MENRDGPEHSKSGVPDTPCAIYLYCLARPDVGPALHGEGVDGRNPILSWRVRDLTAVVSRVMLKDFCGPAADAHMQDLTWLGPRACRHEAVVEHVMRLSPVLPARFGTLFSSLASLERFLKKHHAGIRRFLEQVADKEEWAVKGMLDRKKAREEIFSTILARQKQDLSSLSPGMRYFQEQRMLASVEKELNSWLKEICNEVMDDLSQQAVDFRQRRVLSQSAAKEDMEMVLNCAFLLPRTSVADLRARIDRANAHHAQGGLIFELSGPWPPYSFSSSLLKPLGA